MFGSSKRVKELEERVKQLESLIQKLETRLDDANNFDVKQEVEDALNQIDLECMVETTLENVVDRANFSIRFC